MINTQVNSITEVTADIKQLLPEYAVLAKLHEGPRAIVYRARRLEDDLPVILKVQRAEYPTPADIARIKREYELARGLNFNGIVRAYNLLKFKNGYALVLEDFGGIALSEYLAEYPDGLDLEVFLKIAIQLAVTLVHIHKENVIHKDIKPANIIIEAHSLTIKLTDFSNTVLLSAESQGFRNMNQMEGTLAYVSPEQTGRTNRFLDYRTDFYSLGITFYQLLTGHLPFHIEDPLELIHAHIARTPPPPREINSRVPPVISNLVMKLIAKTAESRYQSAVGLKIDLETCLLQLQTADTIVDFPLGQKDVSDKFRLPQKLYGRDKEIAMLHQTLQSVIQIGASSVIFVSGPPGVGKTLLCQEISTQVALYSGFFIAGKCEEMQQHVPYYALIQAFKELVELLLTESQSHLDRWRDDLHTALGWNAQLLAEVIPNLKLIIGEPQEWRGVMSPESENRLLLAFRNFIRLLARPEHPLVIFLDDAQWIDAATLKLIKHVLAEMAVPHLTLLLGYRIDNADESKLWPTINALRAVQAEVHHLKLDNFGQDEITAIISDTLACAPDAGKLLAELIFQKTEGNPFFVTQFLKSLYDDKLLTFDFDRGVWRWDLAEIERYGITDNIGELMARKIGQLGEDTQQALKLAACVGLEFDLDVVAMLHGRPKMLTAVDLWDALWEGLIVAEDTFEFAELETDSASGRSRIFRFLHQRVQQAAYSLLSDSQKKAAHLKIGRFIQHHTAADHLEERIFDLASHLNLCVDILTDNAERLELVQFNIIAGKKARNAAAYDAAFIYFSNGIGLLAANSWEKHYSLTLDLFNEAAQTAYLCADFATMDTLATVVLSKARTLLDKVRMYEIRIQCHMAQLNMDQAIRTAIKVLKMLGIFIPPRLNRLTVLLGVLHLTIIRHGRKIKEMDRLPLMTNEKLLAGMRILMHACSAAYFVDPHTFAIFALKMMILTLRYGNSPISAFVYTSYGLILSSGLGNLDAGYKFGHLGLHWSNSPHSAELTAKVQTLFNSFIRHWTEPLRSTLDPLKAAYQKGIETGDLEYGCIALHVYCFHMLYLGKELAALQTEMTIMSGELKKFGQVKIYSANEMFRQMTQNLQGLAKDPQILTGECFDEHKMLPVFQQTRDRNALAAFYLLKAQLAYLFTESKAAENWIMQAEIYWDAIMGLILDAQFRFYLAMILLSLCRAASDGDQRRYRHKIAAQMRYLEKWAGHSPANFLHLLYLVEAEYDRTFGDDKKAIEFYDRAIATARENDFLNDEALACECAAKFYLSKNQKKIAGLYLVDAHYKYHKWGATAKVKDLETRYPDMLAFKPAQGGSPSFSSTTTYKGEHDYSSLDLAVVIKASETISGEIVLDQLLKKLMNFVLVNAGAQRGFLVLENDGRLVIEAEDSVDLGEPIVLKSIPLELDERLPRSIVNYAARTRENLVLKNAGEEDRFKKDAYIIAHQPKSVLCIPLVNRSKLIGVVYLENNLTTEAFASERIEVLKLLTSQLAIAIENARLYGSLVLSKAKLEDYSQTLEQKVAERTAELQQKNVELEQTLQQLQSMQEKIVTQQKLASLGQMTAGIAHEIKNPLNFVTNFADLSVDLYNELAVELQAYQDKIPADKMRFMLATMDDLKANLGKISQHGRRADQIVKGMLLHARGKSDAVRATDLNALVDEFVKLAYHGFDAKGGAFIPELKCQYDKSIGMIDLTPQDMSRVIVNMINNSCYSTWEKKKRLGDDYQPLIQITTHNLRDKVEIIIEDNGEGISAENLQRIFNPFFTTKPAGEGTGLGLSISYDLIVKGHGGELKAESRVGEFARFMIVLPQKASPAG